MIGRLPWMAAKGLATVGEVFRKASVKLATFTDDFEGWEWGMREKMVGAMEKVEVLVFGEVIEVDDDDEEDGLP